MQKKPLTAKQEKVLGLIKFHFKKGGHSPSLRWLADKLKCYPNAVSGHLRALEKKNYITVEKGIHRGIKLK